MAGSSSYPGDQWLSRQDDEIREVLDGPMSPANRQLQAERVEQARQLHAQVVADRRRAAEDHDRSQAAHDGMLDQRYR